MEEYKISYKVLISIETFFSYKIKEVNGIVVVNADTQKEAQDDFLKESEKGKSSVFITGIELIESLI